METRRQGENEEVQGSKFKVQSSDIRHQTSDIRHFRVSLHVVGVGQQNAAKQTREAIERLRPTRLLLAGFAGGLAPALPLAAAITVDRILPQQGRRAYALHDDGPPTLVPVSAPASGLSLLTVDDLIASAEHKRRLFERYGADAVDMEGYALARLAAELSLPLTVIRTVSDPADASVPACAIDWLDPVTGRTRGWTVARDVLTHPWYLPTVMRLGRDLKHASQALAQAVASQLQLWSPSAEETTPV